MLVVVCEEIGEDTDNHVNGATYREKVSFWQTFRIGL